MASSAKTQATRLRQAKARIAELEQRVTDLEGWMRSAVWIDPGRQGGRPCLGGHRLPVSSVMSFLAESEEMALHAYPHLTVEQIRLARWYHDTYADQDRTCRWPRPVIHTDPGVNGGEPSIGGVPVTVIAGRIAAGEPATDVAADYRLTRREALTACWWCGSTLDDFADWWARWADSASLILGTVSDDDTVCADLPDPPLMGDDDGPVRPVENVPTGGLL